MGQKLSESQKNHQRQARQNYLDEQARIKQAAKAREQIQKSTDKNMSKQLAAHIKTAQGTSGGGTGSCEKDADGKFSSGNNCGSL